MAAASVEIMVLTCGRLRQSAQRRVEPGLPRGGVSIRQMAAGGYPLEWMPT